MPKHATLGDDGKLASDQVPSGGLGGGSPADASTTVKGIAKLSVAPATASNPIAAGTYDVSVQFKASSGSVTVKERKLWIVSMGF